MYDLGRTYYSNPTAVLLVKVPPPFNHAKINWPMLGRKGAGFGSSEFKVNYLRDNGDEDRLKVKVYSTVIHVFKAFGKTSQSDPNSNVVSRKREAMMIKKLAHMSGDSLDKKQLSGLRIEVTVYGKNLQKAIEKVTE
jgi:hypothetical protein